MEQTIVVLL